MTKTGKRVRLEPALEALAGEFSAGECRALARTCYRWAKQLWVKARVLEADAAPRPRRRWRWLSREQLLRN